MSGELIPRFIPHRLFRGGHAQTLAGSFLPWRRYPYRAKIIHVSLGDGDAVVLHDDCPPGWQPGGPAALMLHGLAGCHESGYMERIAAKLCAAGVRAFRMDLRGCGAGERLAKLPYHAGRSEDALTALQSVEGLCPGSPLCLIGFSLGGNIVLKLLGESPDELPVATQSAVVVCPPIDLDVCVCSLDRFWGRFYDRHFARLLNRRVCASGRRPRGLREFDDVFTAPRSGFASADDYYEKCSSRQFIPGIRVPTRILAAADDPMIPARAFEGLGLPGCVHLHVAEHGGHLGFIGRRGVDADCRWMDWRVVEWITAHAPGEVVAPASGSNGPARHAHGSPVCNNFSGSDRIERMSCDR